MKKHFDRFLEDIKQTHFYSWVERYEDIDETYMKRSTFFYVLWGVWTIALFYLNVTVCKIFNHKWSDEGYATPDSGCIDMVCTRCGFSPGIVWLY